MYYQLNESLTESGTKYKPSTAEDRLKDLYRDNKRTFVKCQCGCFIFRSVRVRPDYIDYNLIFSIHNMFIPKYQMVISSSMTTDNCNHSQSDIDEIVNRKNIKQIRI